MTQKLNSSINKSTIKGFGEMRQFFVRFLFFFIAASIFLPISSIGAQERSATRAGFSLPSDGSARIIVMRPRIVVGEQSTGGSFEPNADWVNQARTNIDAALDSALADLGSRAVRVEIPPGDQEQIVSEYSALFATIARSVITYQFFVGNRLETKKRDNREGIFDWSVGDGVSSLPGADQADYALFIVTEDHFGSTGRKIFQVLAAVTVGAGVQSGLHAGYAGLIDLRTGNLVWINADNAMGGDVREPDGAIRRVGQLLEDFPGRPVPAGTTTP